MTARLFNPIVVACAALLLSVAAGTGWFWLRADAVVVRVLALRHDRAAVAAGKVAELHSQGWDFWTLQMDALASDLKDEKLKLDRKQEGLDRQAGQLAAERQELDRIRADIQSMRQDIDDRVIAIKADEAHNLRSLSQTYASLSPGGAVSILRELDDITVVKILFLMKPDIVGKIFEEMANTQTANGTLAKRAAALSEKLRLMKAGH